MKKNVYDKFNRPNKDLYFMNLCFEVAWKSLDPSTKHGSIFIGKGGEILSTGYNGPPRYSDDNNIPLERPEKYNYMEHSERNAIYNAARNGISLNDSKLYVTGLPCIDCLRGILQVGTTEIVYGPLNSIMLSKNDFVKHYNILLKNQKLKIRRFDYDTELFKINQTAKLIVQDKKKNFKKIIKNEWNV